MRTERNVGASGSLTGTQESVACQALMIITLSFVGATIAFLFTSFMIASNIQAGIQHNNHPISPPSNSLLGLFYLAALIALSGSVLWTRFRSDVFSLPYKEFQQRTFVGLALANVSEYLGVLWVILGGAFALSVPLFAGSAAVILLFSLPSVLRRKTLPKQQSRYDS